MWILINQCEIRHTINRSILLLFWRYPCLPVLLTWHRYPVDVRSVWRGETNDQTGNDDDDDRTMLCCNDDVFEGSYQYDEVRRTSDDHDGCSIGTGFLYWWLWSTQGPGSVSGIMQPARYVVHLVERPSKKLATKTSWKNTIGSATTISGSSRNNNATTTSFFYYIQACTFMYVS